MIPDATHVVGEILQGAFTVEEARPTVSGKIQADHAKALLHPLSHLVPRVEIGTDAVDQRDGRAASLHPVVDIGLTRHLDLERAGHVASPTQMALATVYAIIAYRQLH